MKKGPLYNKRSPKNLTIKYCNILAPLEPMVNKPPTAIIGNNCNLSQFTTIGSNNSNAAVIGDNTYIGPGVNIVEAVKIGNNVTIGAGSVVTKNIPDNATAAGNYAKVLNYNNPARFIKNRWKLERNDVSL